MCVCVCVCEREREREREIGGGRLTETYKYIANEKSGGRLHVFTCSVQRTVTSTGDSGVK